MRVQCSSYEMRLLKDRRGSKTGKLGIINQVDKRRIVLPEKYVMFYETKFTSVIRGHHVYKAWWTPVIGEKLLCKNDKREETKAADLTTLRSVYIKMEKTAVAALMF